MTSDLIKMARVLEKMAQDLRKEAMASDMSKTAVQAFIDASVGWPDEYENLVQTGIPPETAIMMISVKHAAPSASVAYVLRQHRRDVDMQQIELRNREILRLARTGLTNKQLGEKFGLHHITISRIIRRALDA